MTDAGRDEGKLEGCACVSMWADDCARLRYNLTVDEYDENPEPCDCDCHYDDEDEP